MREQKGENKMAKGKRFYCWISPEGITPDAPIAYGNTIEQTLTAASMILLGLHGNGSVITIVEYDAAEGI